MAKSYDALQAEIEKLVSQQEQMKDQKLEVILETFRKEFKKKDFQRSVLNTEDAVLKETVKFFVNNFDNFKGNAYSAVERKRSAKSTTQ